MYDLRESVLKDIEVFLKVNHTFFTNERDFQMKLAVFLKEQGKYEDIEVECYIPVDYFLRDYSSEKKDKYYPWKRAFCKNGERQEMYIDIVVRKGYEYVPIELKYKTKGAGGILRRFGKEIKETNTLKEQGAQDLGRYGFWKDVHRIELVKDWFQNSQVAINGIVIFLTNDKSYRYCDGKNTKYWNYNMSEGSKKEKECSWGDGSSLIAKYPNFSLLNKGYTPIWDGYEVNDFGEKCQFYFAVVEV